jgi:hypothetical protein
MKKLQDLLVEYHMQGKFCLLKTERDVLEHLPSTGGVRNWACIHWLSDLVTVLLICCPHSQKETRPLISVQICQCLENYCPIEVVAINISLNTQ